MTISDNELILTNPTVNPNEWSRLTCSGTRELSIYSDEFNLNGNANLRVNGNVIATAYQGDGSALTGKVSTTGDTMTGPLTVNAALTVTGNVGIGTPTPSAKLEVNGTVKATAFEGDGSALTGISSGKWSDGSSSSIYYNSGNVGIGTTNPQDRLDVNGALRFNGNANTRVYGDLRSGRNTVVLDGHWDELEVKGRVIDWTGSNLHIGYENDHSNHSLYIGNGKLKSVQIQGSTDLIVGGNLVGAAKNTSGQSLRICCGKTPEGTTNWQPYSGGTRGIYVDVDTSACGFRSTPFYLVNMHGNSYNWETTGGSSAYQRTATGFRIYVRFSDGREGLTPAFANQKKWHIQWLALGN